MVSYDELRGRLWEWQCRHFGRQRIEVLCLGVVEEIGELAHCIVKRDQRVRGIDDATFTALATDAIGDIWVWSAQVVSATEARWGVDLSGVCGLMSDRPARMSQLVEGASAALSEAERMASPASIARVFLSLGGVAQKYGIDVRHAITTTAASVLERGPGHPAIPDPDDVHDDAWRER